MKILIAFFSALALAVGGCRGPTHQAVITVQTPYGSYGVDDVVFKAGRAEFWAGDPKTLEVFKVVTSEYQVEVRWMELPKNDG